MGEPIAPSFSLEILVKQPTDNNGRAGKKTLLFFIFTYCNAFTYLIQ
jgi:cytochrome oxidase Cu insertion factor (SCO1/SenC/PrrC family)